MTYIILTLAGLVLGVLFLGIAAQDIQSTSAKILACMAGGIFVAGLTGFLLSLTPFPYYGTGALAAGTVAFVVSSLYGWKTVDPGILKVFQPSLLRANDAPLNINECQLVTPGTSLVWEIMSAFVADIPIGQIILDGATDVDKGVTDVRFRDGSMGKFPFRIEGTPLFSDRESLGRFLAAGTQSGESLSNHGARLSVIYDRWRTTILGPLETAAATRKPSEITRDVIQQALEATPAGGVSAIELLRRESAALGLDPATIIVRVGDITFSDEAKETMATAANNAMIAATQEEIFNRLAPKGVDAVKAELLADQAAEQAKLERATPIDLVSVKAEILGRQKKSAGRKLRPLKAKLDSMPPIADYTRSIAGQKDVAQREARYRAEYMTLSEEVAEAEEDEKTDDLFGEFLAEFKEQEKRSKDQAGTIADLKAANAAGRLTGTFKQKLDDYEALLQQVRSRAFSLAQAGEDASFITIAGLENAGAVGAEGLHGVLRATEGRVKK